MRHLQDRLQSLSGGPTAEERQFAYDFEFMARMLGVRTPRAEEGPELAMRFANEFEERMADPIAVARARHRIGDLLRKCEEAEALATRSAAILN